MDRVPAFADTSATLVSAEQSEKLSRARAQVNEQRSERTQARCRGVAARDKDSLRACCWCAQVVADLISEALRRENPERELARPTAIIAKGFGSTRKLSGFDDGQNHPENRRVEVSILVGDEADEA